MSLFWFLIHSLEWVWCMLMPIIGSLHLLSKRYEESNSSKDYLFRHWCCYWIIYTLLRVLFSFICFFIPSFLSFLYILRILALAIVAFPKFKAAEKITDIALNNTKGFPKLKKTCFDVIGNIVNLDEE